MRRGKSGHQGINGPVNNRGVDFEESIHGKCNRKYTAQHHFEDLPEDLIESTKFFKMVLGKGEMVV